MVTTRQVGALRAVWDVVRGTSRRGAPGVGERLRAVPRMLWLGLTGRYPHLARGRIAVGMLALLYVLSPVDLVPEIVLPLIGLADDALVATWLEHRGLWRRWRGCYGNPRLCPLRPSAPSNASVRRRWRSNSTEAAPVC